MTEATDMIVAERKRQVTEEGFTAEHDDGHADQLIRAAKCYAEAGRFLVRHPHPSVFAYRDAPVDADTGEAYWPWHPSYWKPTGDPVRDLVKAGALIAAAIDSLISERDDSGREES